MIALACYEISSSDDNDLSTAAAPEPAPENDSIEKIRRRRKGERSWKEGEDTPSGVVDQDQAKTQSSENERTVK